MGKKKYDLSHAGSHNPIRQASSSSKSDMFSFEITNPMPDARRGGKEQTKQRRFRNACGCYFGNAYLVALVVFVLSVIGFAGAYFMGLFSKAVDPSSSSTPISVSGKTEIVKAKQSQLYFLEQVLEDGTKVPAARSYDGEDWEGVQPLNLIFQCKRNVCRTEIPNEGSFQVRHIGTDHLPTSTSSSSARFLNQATFGATKDEIATFKDRTSWIRNQVAEAPSSHREYYRERSNFRLSMTGADVGRIRGPCEQNSRWYQYAFSNVDLGKTVTFDTSGSVTLVLVDGEVRTELDPDVTDFGTTSPQVICLVTEGFNGQVKFGTDCKEKTKNQLVKFTVTAPQSDRVVVTAPESSFTDLEKKVEHVKLLSDTATRSCITKTDATLFALEETNGVYYIFDPRVDRVDNSHGANITPARPGEECANVPKSFLNAHTCVADTSACKGPQFSSAQVTLDAASILKFYELGERHVHYVEGLTDLDDFLDLSSPCKVTKSRWMKRSSGECTGDNTDADIVSVIEAAISESADMNGDIVDIDVKGDCSDSSDSAVGAKIMVEGVCYENVHPNEHDVYDFTYWTFTHIGNEQARKGGRPNPIAQAALNDSPSMWFPSHHPLDRWDQALKENNKNALTYIGRLGDTLDFADLPAEVQLKEIADYFGASPTADLEGGVEACGSAGEVPSIPALGMRFATVTVDQNDSNNQASKLSDQKHAANEAKEMVWTNVALRGKDQLRQRVAWALSQILVVSADGVGANNENEKFLNYYDIFVRHAFGNYGDILREVSYSPVMGSMLSYIGSKSFANMLKSTGNEIYPDENYARELMQLFTIGLFKLEIDGSHVLGDDGKAIGSYDNDAIITFARVWTGFQRQASRGNVEMNNGDGSSNNIDPMKIKYDHHDIFPKADTLGGYLGDRVPLCEDLGDKAFLKKGATYRYLGRSSQPVMMYDHKDMASSEKYFKRRKEPLRRFELDPGSGLFGALCNKDSSTGKCAFKSDVVLDADIPCYGNECLVQQPRVVLLNVTSIPTYYEYIRQPCVDLMFPENPTLITNHQGKARACSNPNIPAALATCCPDGTTKCWTSAGAGPQVIFTGERVTKDEAEARCAKAGLNAVSFTRTNYDYSNTFWSHQPCHVQVQVNPDGLIARVDDMGGDGLDHVKIDNRNYFHVSWEGGAWPRVEDDCHLEVINGTNPCSLHVGEHGGSSCLCNIVVEHSVPFSSQDAVPGGKELLEKLNIGYIDASTSGELTQSKIGGKKITAFSDSTGNYTAFKVVDDTGRTHYLKNLVSTVYLKGSGVSFRNPPTYMSVTEATQRDAINDVEALIEHLLYHPNTAPFVSHRLIQRMVSSNPSPRYIRTVAEAFTTGKYEDFGSGVYGDLEATVAAILLDREASSSILDAEPSFGVIREPILKILHLMRSMEYAAIDDEEVELRNMEDLIGQMAWESPTVFNYYEPTFVPHQLASHNIVAPESQLLTAPFMISWLNGVHSLIRYGLTRCWGGFAFDARTSCSDVDNNKKTPSELTNVVGSLTYKPSPLPEPVITPAPTAAPPVENRTCVDDPDWRRWNFDGNTTYNGHDCESSGKRKDQGQAWVCNEYGTSAIDKNGVTDYSACPYSCGSCPHNPEGLIRGSQVVDELSLLLTSGRLSSHARRIIVDEYEKELVRYGDVDKAVRVAMQLLTVSPEFHATSFHDVLDDGDMREVEVVVEEDEGGDGDGGVDGDYKAIVYLMMFGAADSYNFIVPHSGCGDLDLYENYKSVRGSVALDKSSLLQIPVENQVCSTFGLHPSLKHLKKMYTSGDASIVANVGVLTSPITRDEFHKKSPKRPPSLFAHNSQAQALHTARPENPIGSGMLGRVKDVLVGEGYKVGSYSINGNAKVLETDVSGEADVMSRTDGVVPFDKGGQMSRVYGAIDRLTGVRVSSLLGEAYSSGVQSILERTEKLEGALEEVGVEEDYGGTKLGEQFEQVSKVIKANRRKLKNDRDIFYVYIGGWDTHTNLGDKLSSLLTEVDDALEDFTNEMKREGLWEKVAVVSASDFARTLTDNGVGTDHAWAGNHFLVGGSVKGGKVHGRFIDEYGEEGTQNVGRGRLIPTTSWDGWWNGLIGWFGVGEEDRVKVLPNLGNFQRGGEGVEVIEVEDAFVV